MYPDPESQSAKLFERARNVLVGGNTRFSVYTAPYQIYAVSGSGSRIIDADGIERLDMQNNMTVLIHGHAHPAIMERAREQLERGSCFGLATESEIALAELLCSRVPSFDFVRFVNSGTEAVMTALKAARAYTNRPKIAKVEGAYHGSYDYAEISLDSAPLSWGDIESPNSVPYARGTPQGVPEDVVVIPFNDPERALRILESHKDTLAGVLIDPLPGRIGFIPATREFLDMIRDFTWRTGSLLIFDEVICFRLGYGGAQSEFACEPDLTALGKVVGGGFPIGVVGGRKDVMSVFDLTRDRPPLPQGGTFNANPVSMVAGLASMELLTPEVFDRLNGLGSLARTLITEAFASTGAEGNVTGMGSVFRIQLTDRAISDYRTSYLDAAAKQKIEWIWRYLLNNGILINKAGAGALSTVTTEAEINIFAKTVLAGLSEMRSEEIAAA
jgi:glutamate-1-semialdehyde 2,1-aminomutase